jgi:hypothetical protein
MATLKVKDYTYSYTLIVVCCTFPLFLIILANCVDQNYLLAFLITLVIYTTAFIYFVKYLQRTEDEYLIFADEQRVTFLKKGTYQWADVKSVAAFNKVQRDGFAGTGTRYEAKFITVNLTNGKSLTIEVSNCDYENQDIARKLKEIGKLG